MEGGNGAPRGGAPQGMDENFISETTMVEKSRFFFSSQKANLNPDMIRNRLKSFTVYFFSGNYRTILTSDYYANVVFHRVRRRLKMYRILTPRRVIPQSA